MRYRRIEDRSIYKIYTTVEDSGKIYGHIRYNDGTLGANTISGTVYSNGWGSVAEYLNNNPGFEALE